MVRIVSRHTAFFLLLIDRMQSTIGHYAQLYIQKISVVLLVLAAINSGAIGCIKVNLIERLVGKSIGRLVYILMGVAAMIVAFHRDTYLPFLGEAVFPWVVLQGQEPTGATRSMPLRVSPNTKVVYWAAEPTSGSLQFADKAYGGYNNAGVALSDQGGNVVLKVREPQPYTVPLGKLEPHIHFRECSTTGFLGPVKTVYFNGYVEGFRV